MKKNLVKVRLTPAVTNNTEQMRKLKIELGLKLRKISFSKKYRNVPALLMQNVKFELKKSDKRGTNVEISRLDATTIVSNIFKLKPLKFIE